MNQVPHSSPSSSAVAGHPAHRLAFVAPRHPDGSDWPWLTHIPPFSRHHFEPHYIENTYKPFEKVSRAYVYTQYVQTLAAISTVDLAFTFSTDICLGLSGHTSRVFPRPKMVYVGFTQDGPWPVEKVESLSRAMQRYDAVTVFSEVERRMCIDRYRLDPVRVHVIPIHTDELDDYRQYTDPAPFPHPYILSMGLPNRRFLPIARACKSRNIPLVIITRPTYKTESLDELAALGATIITNADKRKSLTALQHARFSVYCFLEPNLPGAVTTIIHANFFRKPVIVSRCFGIDEYVRDAETGIVVPHEDDAALDRAIDRLWSDPASTQRMGTIAHERAKERYSLQAAARS
ncbi:MAG TPA: glycosyltransferase, partial [Phycisphaerales bacterium]|nr:glycosyltransferase [Phycisphaerales bacterium]